MFNNLFHFWFFGFFVFSIMCAIRGPNEEFRGVFIVSVFWFINVPLIVLSNALYKFGIKFDIKYIDKLFGFRWATNKLVKGFGITVFKYELQFFKPR